MKDGPSHRDVCKGGPGSDGCCPVCGDFRWSMYERRCLSPECSPINVQELNEYSRNRKKKKAKKEVEVLPPWLMKKPRTKKARAEAVRYCRLMGLDLPPHLIE